MISFFQKFRVYIILWYLEIYMYVYGNQYQHSSRQINHKK
jgi:hypothetical protein